MPLQPPAVLHPTVAPPQIGAETPADNMAQALLYQRRLVSEYGYGGANAAQVAEANRYKLDVERALHPDVNIPGGTPAWVHEITSGIADIRASIAGINTEIAGINARLDTMDTRLDTMDTRLNTLVHSTSQMRMLALANNQTAANTSILSPVPHETTGIMPPDTFPRTLEELNGFTVAQVTELLTFYGLPLQGGLAAKRKRLKQAIGVRTDL